MRAATAVNRELVTLYWEIGNDILHRKAQAGWAAKVIDRIAADLHKSFPEVRGFSPRNLKYMRAFVEAWPNEAILCNSSLHKFPGATTFRIPDSVHDHAQREWHIR